MPLLDIRLAVRLILNSWIFHQASLRGYRHGADAFQAALNAYMRPTTFAADILNLGCVRGSFVIEFVASQNPWGHGSR